MPSPQFSTVRLPRYMSQEEVGRFFSVIDPLRDRTLFTLIYHYGLRVGEVPALQRSDVDFTRGRVVIRRLKGGAWSERPLFEATLALLRAYLGSLGMGAGQPLFAGRSGPLQKRQIQSLFTRYRDQAGLAPRLTCHSLRHSIATHLLDAGMSLTRFRGHFPKGGYYVKHGQKGWAPYAASIFRGVPGRGRSPGPG